MRVQEHFDGGMLRLKVSERALVKRPNWDDVAALKRQDAALVALDLEDVDFISSLFLQGCVELGRTLARRGGHLVLLHLSPHQKRLLELVEGTSSLAVVDDDEQLKATVNALSSRPGPDRPDEGVTRAEKGILWS